MTRALENREISVVDWSYRARCEHGRIRAEIRLLSNIFRGERGVRGRIGIARHRVCRRACNGSAARRRGRRDGRDTASGGGGVGTDSVPDTGPTEPTPEPGGAGFGAAGGSDGDGSDDEPTIPQARSGTAATTSSTPTHRSRAPARESWPESTSCLGSTRPLVIPVVRDTQLEGGRGAGLDASFGVLHDRRGPDARRGASRVLPAGARADTGTGVPYPGRGARHRRDSWRRWRWHGPARRVRRRPAGAAGPAGGGTADRAGRRPVGSARRVRCPRPVGDSERRAGGCRREHPADPRNAAAVSGDRTAAADPDEWAGDPGRLSAVSAEPDGRPKCQR